MGKNFEKPVESSIFFYIEIYVACLIACMIVY
jgi:hypothetical protein